MIEMIREVISKGRIRCRYLLFDSWFSMPKNIIKVIETGLDAVGRLKNTSKIHYMIDDEKLTLKDIYKGKHKRRGKSKYLLSAEAYIKSRELYDTPIKIVFIRDKNNRKKWIALFSSDVSLSEEEIIKLYSRRWDIEVLFKMCKSYLKLGRENRSLSYDSLVAHVSIVFSRYILLSVEHRKSADPRTLGEIFCSVIDELNDIRFYDAINLILELLVPSMLIDFCIEENVIDRFMEDFIAKLPTIIRCGISYKKVA